MTDKPLITVVTTVFNNVDTIRRCIESVMNQTYKNIEYIVIDANSTDGTKDIIDEYKDRIDHYQSEPDRSLYDGMNKGLRVAKGDYVHFLNADDHYVHETTLEQIANKLDIHSVCFGDLIYIEKDRKQRRMGEAFNWQSELKYSHVPQPTTIVPRHLYRQVGEFDLKYHVAADYEMLLRLAQRFPVKHITVPMTMMYSGGLSMRLAGQARKETRRISIKYGRNILAAWMTYIISSFKWMLYRSLPRPIVYWVQRKQIAQALEMQS